MRILRRSELKGIIGLLGIVLLLFFVYFGLNGKLAEWFGPKFRLTTQKPLTNRIVFVSDRNGSSDIWVMNPDGSDAKPLTNDAYEDFGPVVSPDGYTVAFISKRDTQHNQIFAMDPDGSHIHRLSNITGAKSSLYFSPDGKELIFLCGGSVWMVKVNEDSPDKLLPTHAESGPGMGDSKSPYIWAEYSYDGKLLGAVQATDQGQFPVWMKLDMEKPNQVTQDTPQGPVAVAGELMSAAWAPSSLELAIGLDTPTGAGILAVVDTDSGQLRLITKSGPLSSLQWSPDGGSIAALSMKRLGINDYVSEGLFVTDTSGNKKVFSAKDAEHPIWSADSKSIVFVRGSDIMSLETGTRKIVNLTKGKGSNSDPSFAGEGKK